MPETKFLTELNYALMSGVPLVCVTTSDPAQIQSQVEDLVNNKKNTETYNSPLVSWDVASGLSGRNNKGNEAISELLSQLPKTPPPPTPDKFTDPGMVLRFARFLPKKSILLFHNGHRFIGNSGEREAIVGQAIWNLRDQFKKSERMLLIICPSISLPPELQQDVLVLDDPLPTPKELKEILLNLYSSTHEQEPSFPEKPSEEIEDKAVEAGRGLSAFAYEQASSMSLRKNGIDLERLWKIKRTQIDSTQGLSIYKGHETFADVRGVERIKDYLTKIFNGEDAPTSLVFLDEVEKSFAGIEGDTSGTSQEQHGEFLRWSQDNSIPGIVFVGHPGCSKTLVCKATAGEFKTQMIELNITALKGSLVGQTGEQTRNALKKISAMGRPMMIATSNNLSVLPPELKRRFRLGIFFFDLPNRDERDSVWNLYISKYKLKDTIRPEDNDWTPADIETCCNLAWRLKISLVEASGYLVPISQSNPEKIEELRIKASGKFLSANHPGVYVYDKFKPEPTAIVRSINFSETGQA